MQDAAFFQAVHADIDVLPHLYRQATEDGVAVVFLRENGVFAVARVIGETFGNDVVVRTGGEIGQFQFAQQVLPLHFLQKQDVGLQAFQCLRHVRNLHFSVQRRHAFMDIVGGDGNRLGHDGLHLLEWISGIRLYN